MWSTQFKFDDFDQLRGIMLFMVGYPMYSEHIRPIINGWDNPDTRNTMDECVAEIFEKMEKLRSIR